MLLFVTPEDLAHLRRARDLMDREYARPAMARAALMSPSHFARGFGRRTGRRRRRIGLEVRTDQTIEGGYRWLTVGPAEQPGVEIGLSRIGPPVPPTDFEALEALLAKGSLQGIIFVDDDVDAKFEQVRTAGGEVLREPIDQYYGVRDCAFRDPSGNMIRFSSPRPAQP